MSNQPMPVSRPLWSCLSENAEATRALGRWLGDACQGGEIVLLDGPLGAGKTCLAGGVGEGLGIEDPIVSPTFTLERIYEGRDGLSLHHFDCYRLGGDDDLEEIGFEEAGEMHRIVLVEWPERCPSVFRNYTLALKFDLLEGDRRRIRAWAGPLDPPAGWRSALPLPVEQTG